MLTLSSLLLKLSTKKRKLLMLYTHTHYFILVIGGTSLRLCYNSSRLSENLDFNGGYDFKPSDFNGLENDIQHYLSKKYEVEVCVNKPNQEK